MRRRGVASVVGTIFFVVVFMVAMGALVYVSGLELQGSEAAQKAGELSAMHSAEDISFRAGTGGLEAINLGPGSSELNHLLLVFPNGTVYTIPVNATLESGGELGVAGIVPSTICPPGSATCASKYALVVSGGAPGSSLGLVTSLGNVYWYSYGETQVSWSSIGGFPPGCPAGESITQLGTTVRCSTGGPYAKVITASARTSGTDNFTTTGLVAALSNDTLYVFFAFTSISPALGVEQYAFEVHALPPGATLLIACSPMAYPLGGGNQGTNCVNSAGTQVNIPLEFGVSPPVFETPGIFGAVAMGSAPGKLEIDLGCVRNCGSVEINPGSFIIVQASS